MTAKPKSLILPPAPVAESARQAALDAAAVLQVRRSELAPRVSAGPCPGAEIVAVGKDRVNEWILESAHEWHELLSVRPSATVARARISLPVNRYFTEQGVEMVSFFDHDGTEPAARTLMANEPLGTYLFGAGPVQMKIVDRRFALLEGPDIDGQASVMKVTSHPCMEAAWRYWEAAVASAIPVEPTKNHGTLTPRQQQVVGLLAADLGDEAIADALGVSVRTVRSDIAAVLESLGVKSRFAAAARLQLSESER